MKNMLRAHIRRGLRQLSLVAGALGATFLLPMPHALAATFDLATATGEKFNFMPHVPAGGRFSN